MNNSLKELAIKYGKLSHSLRTGCLEYLAELLYDNGGSIDWEDVELPEFVSVVYDGGSHPEYASNAFSTIYGITKKDNYIYLRTEDCDEYNVGNATADELYALCDFLDNYKQEIGIK